VNRKHSRHKHSETFGRVSLALIGLSQFREG